MAEGSEGLGADRNSWLGAGVRLQQRRSKAIWTAMSLVRGNKWDRKSKAIWTAMSLVRSTRCSIEGGSEGSAESRLGAGLRLEQRRSTTIWTTRSLVRGNRWDRCFIEGGSAESSESLFFFFSRQTQLAGGGS